MSAPKNNQNAAKPEAEKLSGDDSRNLNIRVMRSDFGVWKWAWDTDGKDQSSFVRGALREKVSKVASEQIQKGKTIPPFVVEFLARENKI